MHNLNHVLGAASRSRTPTLPARRLHARAHLTRPAAWLAVVGSLLAGQGLAADAAASARPRPASPDHQEQVGRRIAGTWWLHTWPFPIVGEGLANVAGGFTFHADGTWTVSSVAELGEVLFDLPPELGLGPLRLAEGTHTPMRGAWRATGPRTWEGVGVSLYRRTGATGAAGDPATTLIFRTHLRGGISPEDPDSISMLSKTVALLCLNPWGQFDQFACPDPTQNVPAFDEVFFLGPDGNVVLTPSGEPLPAPTAPMELRRLKVNLGR